MVVSWSEKKIRWWGCDWRRTGGIVGREDEVGWWGGR